MSPRNYSRINKFHTLRKTTRGEGGLCVQRVTPRIEQPLLPTKKRVGRSRRAWDKCTDIDEKAELTQPRREPPLPAYRCQPVSSAAHRNKSEPPPRYSGALKPVATTRSCCFPPASA